jgi:hypothetical protein
MVFSAQPVSEAATSPKLVWPGMLGAADGILGAPIVVPRVQTGH